MTQDYKAIFTRIEDTLRRESSLSPELFDSRFGGFKNTSYKNMTDKEIFWVMVYVAFYSGMRASTVTQRLPAIKKYLYDFKVVKEYSHVEIEQIMNDPETIHYQLKIQGCITNAKAFSCVLNKFGSFARYIGSYGALSNEKNIDRLRADLRGRFKFLGERTVNHFLTDLGINVLKPDRVVCRILSRLELLHDENDTARAIDVGKEIALATGYSIRYVDIIFVKYGQMGKDDYFGTEDGICLNKNPKCEKCGVSNYCKHHTTCRTTRKERSGLASYFS